MKKLFIALMLCMVSIAGFGQLIINSESYICNFTDFNNIDDIDGYYTGSYCINPHPYIQIDFHFINEDVKPIVNAKQGLIIKGDRNQSRRTRLTITAPFGINNVCITFTDPNKKRYNCAILAVKKCFEDTSEKGQYISNTIAQSRIYVENGQYSIDINDSDICRQIVLEAYENMEIKSISVTYQRGPAIRHITMPSCGFLPFYDKRTYVISSDLRAYIYVINPKVIGSLSMKQTSMPYLLGGEAVLLKGTPNKSYELYEYKKSDIGISITEPDDDYWKYQGNLLTGVRDNNIIVGTGLFIFNTEKCIWEHPRETNLTFETCFDTIDANINEVYLNWGKTHVITQYVSHYASWWEHVGETKIGSTSYITLDGNIPDIIINTFDNICVKGMTTIFNQGDSFVFDGTCTAYYTKYICNDIDAIYEGKAPELSKYPKYSYSSIVNPTYISYPNMRGAGHEDITVRYTPHQNEFHTYEKETTYRIFIKPLGLNTDEIFNDPTQDKLIENGHIYIQSNGKRYDMLGREIH